MERYLDSLDVDTYYELIRYRQDMEKADTPERQIQYFGPLMRSLKRNRD